MTQPEYKEFLQEGGIHRIGHRSNTVLNYLVILKEESEDKEVLRILKNTFDYQTSAKFPSDRKNWLDKLENKKIIKSWNYDDEDIIIYWA